MIRMFTQFFSMLSMLFSAGERTAKSLDNLAKWAEDESGTFVENAAIEREAKLAQAMAARDNAIRSAQASTAPTAIPTQADTTESVDKAA